MDRDLLDLGSYMKYYLGLDFGTSGVRACVVNELEVIAHKDRIHYPDVTSQTYLNWREALHALMRRLPRNLGAELHGVAIAATSATVLLCDGSLEPIAPALLYFDGRAQAESEELKRLAPPGHIASSASSGLAKFLWLTRNTELLNATYFLHQADWLTALLTGFGGVSDYHNVLKSGYDVERMCWPDWIKRLPHAHLLPQVVAPGANVACIDPLVAKHFNINEGCIISAGTTDSIASFIAVNGHGAGFAVTSLGTTMALKLLSEQRVESAHHGVYSHRYGDMWLAGGASNAGGGVLRQYFSDDKINELSQGIDPGTESPLDYYPLPRLGERFPINDPAMEPRLTPRPADDSKFLHGLLQGLSRIEATGYAKLVELGANPPSVVVTTGGGAKNKTWGRIRESLLGVPLQMADQTEAALGAAMLARRGLVQG